MQILGGSASADLAQSVAGELGLEAQMPGFEFPNGEVACELPVSVRGQTVYVIGSHCRYSVTTDEWGAEQLRSPQDAFFEQFLTINAAKTSWTGRVVAVAPFTGYGRQDRRTGRQPVTSALTLQTLSQAGAGGMVTIDMHSPQAEGFFDGPFEHLTAAPVLADHLKDRYDTSGMVVVAPDTGAFKATKRFCSQLKGAGLAVIDDKQRQVDGSVQASRLLGAEVTGKMCVLLDDMIDGGGTVAAASRIVRAQGASRVVVAATHGVFSGKAPERLNSAPIDEIVVTDTIPLPEAMRAVRPDVHVVTVAGLLANALRAIHEGRSVNALYAGMAQRI